jgi:hypothetical protein
MPSSRYNNVYNVYNVMNRTHTNRPPIQFHRI